MRWYCESGCELRATSELINRIRTRSGSCQYTGIMLSMVCAKLHGRWRAYRCSTWLWKVLVYVCGRGFKSHFWYHVCTIGFLISEWHYIYPTQRNCVYNPYTGEDPEPQNGNFSRWGARLISTNNKNINKKLSYLTSVVIKRHYALGFQLVIWV